MGLLTFSINVTLDGCVDHQEGIADDEQVEFGVTAGQLTVRLTTNSRSDIRQRPRPRPLLRFRHIMWNETVAFVGH